MATDNDEQGMIGWCYFSVTSDIVNEAISMDVYSSDLNPYEIRMLEFGRP